MTKSDFIDALQDRADLDSNAQAQRVLDAFLEIVTETLANGEDVTLTGFGTFRVTRRSARKGRNPQTGEEIQIPARIVPKFKAGKGLKDAVQ